MAGDLDRSLLPEVFDDLRALVEDDEALISLAFEAITDVARGRKVGKALGDREVTGDLSGLRRLKFDRPEVGPERYRVVYRLLPDDDSPETVEVIAVGPRGGHAVYREAVDRLADER
jgi:hypothetical protein